MTDAITIDHIQTETSYNLEKLFNEANQFDKDNLNDSPFAQMLRHHNTHASLFCLNCRSLNAHWDPLQELLLSMSTTKFQFDFIGLTEICDDVNYKLNGYHDLQFNTRPDTDDGNGGVALYIKDNLTYVKRDDLSIFIPHVFESIFFLISCNSKKTYNSRSRLSSQHSNFGKP